MKHWIGAFLILLTMLSIGDLAALAQEPGIDADAIELAIAGVDRNDGWQPAVQEIDGVKMVLGPAGCFLMGSTDQNIDAVVTVVDSVQGEGEAYRNHIEDEQPQHTQCFDEPFWIDRYEVTNELYGSIGCEVSSSKPDQPRNCINWFDAKSFCESRSARLPTEAEWEYATRGPDSLIYPWGDMFDGSIVNSCDTNCKEISHDSAWDDGYMASAPVGSYSASQSWIGAMDLSGNLYEWTSTQHSIFDNDGNRLPIAYPYIAEDGRENESDITGTRVLRGGSWIDAGWNLRASFRLNNLPFVEWEHYGFRCTRDFEG
jgi:formylglycine-generating enzyme required for sulfatase activity